MQHPGGAPPPEPPPTLESVAGLLEHTLLRPDLPNEFIYQACLAAREYGLAAVVVRPCDAEAAVRWLAGSPVRVAAVVGYPYGYSTTATKLYEGRDLLRMGVQELDFVLSAPAMVARQFQHVETELVQIVESAHQKAATVKIVFNNRFLADDLKIIGTKIAKRVESDYLSIDYRETDLAIFKPLLKDVLKLKCAGPVDTLSEVLAMKEANFQRIGTTAPATILEDWKKHLASLEPAAPALPS
ncbi:MAG TPA: hypothetical protein VEQ63_15820 [Bryobacteraceae bacterium]|nr:hypothetical protein [Bryobacteraceae bacterium]